MNHVLRRQGIGSSEIGAVAGLDDYRGPWDVWKSKLHGDDFHGNLHTDIGHALEPLLLARYAARESVELAYPGTIKFCAFGVDTVDALAPTACVEAKTASWRQREKWGDEGTDEIPDSYLAQCAWHMAAHKLERCDVVALLDRDVRYYVVHRNAAFETALLTIAEEFWNQHILTAAPPALDGSRAASEHLRSIRQKDSDFIECAEAVPYAEELRALRAEISELESREALASQKLQELIGPHQGLSLGEMGKIHWKEQTRETVDWKSIAAEYGPPPVLIQKHTTVKVIRPFVPKLKG